MIENSFFKLTRYFMRESSINDNASGELLSEISDFFLPYITKVLSAIRTKLILAPLLFLSVRGSLSLFEKLRLQLISRSFSLH